MAHSPPTSSSPHSGVFHHFSWHPKCLQRSLSHPKDLCHRVRALTLTSSTSGDNHHTSGGHFGWVGAILRRWQSHRDDLHSIGEQSRQNHHHHHYHHHHRHCHHHFPEARHGLGCLWRRGEERGRAQHRPHSLASVELATWSARANSRRGSTLPFSLSPALSLSPLDAANKCQTLEGVQAAIVKLFQRKTLRENELGVLQDSVRTLSEAEAGSLIYEYYKDQLLKKGMVILREKIKNEQGAELLSMLGETWDYFFTDILPTLQALMYPLAEILKDVDVRNTTLLEFRNIVVLKVGLKDAVEAKKYEVPDNIRQMLLVLQGLQDPVFLSKEQLDMERLTACVIVPYLGSRGLYQGGPEPVTRATFRPPLPTLPTARPKITITASDDKRISAPLSSSPRLIKTLDLHHHHHHPLISPAAMRKVHDPTPPPSTSPHHDLTHPHRLKPVMEVTNDVTVGRRHSIVGT